ncbi:nuclease-related domain-containing protein [Piscibacillus halophilus]|uniref:Nuclease-related domain-containing protein n=1 Tax=Piscibacillus halophilus TaxID=571933 RepID=A0A1H9HQ68_9BACI|nr:nuclease-related domain-containing protein [Piscibacillus halophilus]SEQ64457.1 Nuclease-related domain-containing protein [Piscibacillus halophilus]
MILKQHEVPYNLLSTIAILLRLPESHSKFQNCKQEVANYYSGYKGELALDYYLTFVDQLSVHILHDVRLPFINSHYQIDTLILTPNFIVNIEVKNLTGFIRFNHEMGRMYQYIGQKERSYQDPLLQANSQAHQLKAFLYNEGLSHIPIESLIIFVNQKASLSEERDKRIIYGFQLKQRFDEFSKKYQNSSLLKINSLTQKLIQQNQPLQINMLKHLGIREDELIYGVICPHCLHIPMLRVYGRWICQSCLNTFRAEAHVRSFYEYALIISNIINNKNARKLLNVDSIHVIQKLLKKAGFTPRGETSNRTYLIDVNLQNKAQYLLNYYLKMSKQNRFGEKRVFFSETN